MTCAQVACSGSRTEGLDVSVFRLDKYEEDDNGSNDEDDNDGDDDGGDPSGASGFGFGCSIVQSFTSDIE